MKQAKTRGSPTLARLTASTQRADRAISSAVHYVSASNRRLDKNKTGTLNQLLADMPAGLPVGLAWENLARMGQEVVACNEPSAADQMRVLMESAPPVDISAKALRALIDEGRD